MGYLGSGIISQPIGTLVSNRGALLGVSHSDKRYIAIAVGSRSCGPRFASAIERPESRTKPGLRDQRACVCDNRSALQAVLA